MRIQLLILVIAPAANAHRCWNTTDLSRRSGLASQPGVALDAVCGRLQQLESRIERISAGSMSWSKTCRHLVCRQRWVTQAVHNLVLPMRQITVDGDPRTLKLPLLPLGDDPPGECLVSRERVLGVPDRPHRAHFQLFNGRWGAKSRTGDGHRPQISVMADRPGSDPLGADLSLSSQFGTSVVWTGRKLSYYMCLEAWGPIPVIVLI